MQIVLWVLRTKIMDLVNLIKNKQFGNYLRETRCDIFAMTKYAVRDRDINVLFYNTWHNIIIIIIIIFRS